MNLYYGFNGVGQTLNKLFNCHGFGMCGTCRVLITQGMQNANPMTMMEKVKFRCAGARSHAVHGLHWA